MNNSAPRFQYSIFDRNGYDAQWVVRGDEWEQFLLDVEAIKLKVKDNEMKHDPIMAVTKTTITHPCKSCAGEGTVSDTDFKNGVSSAGKPWSGYFCKRVKEHV